MPLSNQLDLRAISEPSLPVADTSKTDEYKSKRDKIAHLKRTIYFGPVSIHTNLRRQEQVHISDVYFVNERSEDGRIGCIITMNDEAGRANIIHYGSNMCRGVMESPMESDLNA